MDVKIFKGDLSKIEGKGGDGLYLYRHTEQKYIRFTARCREFFSLDQIVPFNQSNYWKQSRWS